MNKDIPQPHETPMIGSYGNIHTDFRETQMLSAYRAFNELERYEGLQQNIYTNDNEHPQTTVLQQIGVETNGNSICHLTPHQEDPFFFSVIEHCRLSLNIICIVLISRFIIQSDPL